MPIVVQAILLLAYFITGCILSWPYTYLAGGSPGHWSSAAWLTPVATLLLYATYLMKRGRCRRENRCVAPFWVLLTYFCLPVLLNGVSFLLKSVGCEVVGSYVFEVRYVSLLFLPMLLVIGLTVVSGMHSICRWFSRGGVTLVI